MRRMGNGVSESCQELEPVADFKKEMELHLSGENLTVQEFIFAPGSFFEYLPFVCA